jgi:hypothetical protein
MGRTDLIAAAQEAIGSEETVRAAGVFGLQDDYRAITAGGLVTSIAMPDGGNPALAGIEGAAGVELGRQANAARQRVTVRMLVAVTDRTIHVFALPMAGDVPQTELMRFDRASTSVEIKKFGLSRRVKLTDRNDGRHLGLTGSTAPFSSVAKGDKAVLAQLASSS